MTTFEVTVRQFDGKHFNREREGGRFIVNYDGEHGVVIGQLHVQKVTVASLMTAFKSILRKHSLKLPDQWTEAERSRVI